MIFNKNNKGAEELKAILGFIYKSNSFANMISFIGFAQRDIRKVIGDGVFDFAQAHYLSDHYRLSTPDQGHPEYTVLDDLVESIQLPVALHAYRRYAPNNDLTHSDSGRSIVVTETEKPAFEWMIDKSDKSLLDLAHEATDILLEFLEKYLDYKVTGSQDPLIPWGTSKEFEASRKLFITRDEFNNEFFIDGSRRVFLAISPSIRKVQENEILSCLGKEKYDEIAEQILDGDLTPSNIALLSLIRPALVFISLSRSVISLSVEILPNGIFSNFITGTINSKNAAAASQRIEISKALMQQGRQELTALQEKITRAATEAAGDTYSVEDPTERIDPEKLYVRL